VGVTAERSSKTRQRVLLALKVVLSLIVLVYVGRVVAIGWRDFRSGAVGLELQWRWIVASMGAFLIAYAVLVQTWRAVLSEWGSHVRFWDAAHIFAVSSLARYVPGKLWQIGAMSMLAKRAGASPTAAAGAAVVSTLANVATGLLVVLATGWSLVGLAYRSGGRWGVPLLVGAGIVLVATPWLLPPVLRQVERLLGRSLSLGRLPPRAIAYAVIGNVVACLIYGVAFWLLTLGVLGSAPGRLIAYVAVYTMSYIFGYLMLFAPAGVGFRESAMILVMPAAGLGGVGEATVMAVASRLTLTILEMAPGLLFLTRSLGEPHESTHVSDGSD
jgi:glycosyltransferase 2 family protein